MQVQQRGAGLIGTLVMLVGLVVIVILGMRLVPAYIEYFTIKKAVTSISESDAATPQEIRTAFQRRADIDDISSVHARDLVITRDGIAFAYEKRLPLFANVNLLIDFSGDAQRSGRRIE